MNSAFSTVKINNLFQQEASVAHNYNFVERLYSLTPARISLRFYHYFWMHRRKSKLMIFLKKAQDYSFR